MDATVSADAIVVVADPAPVQSDEVAVAAQRHQTPAASADGASGDGGLAATGAGPETDMNAAAAAHAASPLRPKPAEHSSSLSSSSSSSVAAAAVVVSDQDVASWVAQPPAALREQTLASATTTTTTAAAAASTATLAAGDAALPTYLGKQPPQPQLQPQPTPAVISTARTSSTPDDTAPSTNVPTESTSAESQRPRPASDVSMGGRLSTSAVDEKPASHDPPPRSYEHAEHTAADFAVTPSSSSQVEVVAVSQNGTGGAHVDPGAAPEQGLNSDDHVPIDYDYDDVQGHRILRLKPTTSQWDDFPAVLAYARKLGAQGDGCFKVIIPDNLLDPLPEKAPKAVPANAYRVKQVRKTTIWQVSTVPSDGEFSSTHTGPDFTDTVDVAFKNLRRLFRTNKDRQMRNVRYRVDVPAWTPRQRLEAGVPERSPLHPLKGDKLDDTKAVIPGIHTPYVYESGPYFGATFQIHAEDFRLASLNHLYKGRKIWVVIPATAVDVAEMALGRGDGCSQFMRHRAEFFFPDKLEKLGIPYRLVDQRPGETIVILPDAYHEGFSTGYTLAEAKNYADASWNSDTYQPCDAACKLVTAIPAAFMRPVEDGEARLDLCAAYGDDGKLKPLETVQKRPHDAMDDNVDAAALAPFVSKSMQAAPFGEPDVKRVKV
ncbi:jumonji domain-containing 2D [Purpureocillium lavendulum]|uniref:Jumonji domain-containing 2D n=1 Tax=Purpureocillium lavendulum TaxID=1247861 RepID=A0AB34FUL7_9HYPO|nr:jumonji domain-containing 2D [Purpureocillium lavendulum]